MIATELQDILFGTPAPILGRANLGVLERDEVNLIIHGHEPLLSEMIVAVAQEPKMIDLAKSKGAKGINLAGICCTANEILMRHGVPLAGNFMQQELAVSTGAVEAVVVDLQCIMPGLKRVASCFHTKLFSTSPKAKFPGMEHIEFDEEHALEIAKRIVKKAVEMLETRSSTSRSPRWVLMRPSWGLRRSAMSILASTLTREVMAP